MTTKKRQAIFFIEPGLVSSAVLSSWIRSGNQAVKLYVSNENVLKPKKKQSLEDFLAGYSTLSTIAKLHSIPIVRTDVDKKGIAEDVLITGADTLFTVMTHFIIKPEVLNKFGPAAINIHPALLPAYKGPLPSQSMRIDGKADEYGGITAHVLTEGIDQGAIIMQLPARWSPERSPAVWSCRQAIAAQQIMVEGILPYLAGTLKAEPQIAGSGFYRKSNQQEFQITADKTLEEVTLLFGRLGNDFLRVCHAPGEASRLNYRVSKIRQKLGKPTQKPPKVGLLYAEMDLADARVVFNRRSLLKCRRLDFI